MDVKTNNNLKFPENFNSDLKELMSRFINLKTKSNNDSYSVGKVVDNNDPDKLGRCKILVYGKFDGIPDSDLPWALPEFGLSNEFIVPPIGNLVNVYFRDGDIYCPCYTRNVINRNSLSDERLEDYPDKIVLFATEKGDYATINKKTQEIVFHTASGFDVTIDILGNVSLDTTNTSTGVITVTSRTKIKLVAPIIETPVGTVTPNILGGMMNCLQFDPLTGNPHQGTTLTGI